MEQKLSNRLLLIASIALTAAGIIFLCLSIFTDRKDATTLAAALGCIVLANLFNVIRGRLCKKQSKEA